MKRVDITIIALYSALFLLSELSLVGFAFFYAWLFFGSIIAILASFVLYFVGFSVDYEGNHFRFFDKIANKTSRANVSRWILLQRIFQILPMVFLMLSLIIGILCANTLPTGSIGRGIYLALSLLFPVLSFYYINSARNLLGMGFTEGSCSSTCRVKAFAWISLNLFMKKKSDRGINNLLKSCNLLHQLLRDKGVSCEDFDKAHNNLSLLNAIPNLNDLPLQSLKQLSEELSKLENLCKVPEYFRQFNNSADVQEHVSGYNIIKPSRRRFFEQIGIIIALITAVATIVQAILPEDWKKQIGNGLVALLAPSFITVGLDSVFAMILLFLIIRSSKAYINSNDLIKRRKKSQNK